MLSESVKSVMDAVITAVNFIRSRALHHRLSQQLCEEMGAEYTQLLYHTELRCVFRGKLFQRVLGVQDEVQTF